MISNLYKAYLLQHCLGNSYNHHYGTLTNKTALIDVNVRYVGFFLDYYGDRYFSNPRGPARISYDGKKEYSLFVVENDKLIDLFPKKSLTQIDKDMMISVLKQEIEKAKENVKQFL